MTEAVWEGAEMVRRKGEEWGTPLLFYLLKHGHASEFLKKQFWANKVNKRFKKRLTKLGLLRVSS